jgi:hypothetical protein
MDLVSQVARGAPEASLWIAPEGSVNKVVTCPAKWHNVAKVLVAKVLVCAMMEILGNLALTAAHSGERMYAA